MAGNQDWLRVLYFSQSSGFFDFSNLLVMLGRIRLEQVNCSSTGGLFHHLAGLGEGKKLDQGKEVKQQTDTKADDQSPHERLLADSAPPPKGKTATLDASKERVIDISETDKIFGWWQKKQYADLGVQKIHLQPNKIALDLKAPTEKYNILQLDRKVAFDFKTNSNGWTLTDVKGLKLKDVPITKIESNASKVIFTTGNKTSEYGSTVNNYLKAVFDPLMRKDLRN